MGVKNKRGNIQDLHSLSPVILHPPPFSVVSPLPSPVISRKLLKKRAAEKVGRGRLIEKKCGGGVEKNDIQRKAKLILNLYIFEFTENRSSFRNR